MDIQTYQIHNVLNVYRKQLSQGRSDPFRHGDARHTHPDPAAISLEGKNEAVMEKVAASVRKRITRVDAASKPGRASIQSYQKKEAARPKIRQDLAFTFNTISKNNQKETRSIAIDDSQMLMSRLDELAKAAADRESG
ncbi:MAG: DVU0524 family FlgM-associated protein [Desulfosarcina sp.]